MLTPWLDQPVPFEQLRCRRSSGEGQGWSLLVKDPQQLGRSPTKVLAADGQEYGRHILPHPVGARAGCMRTVFQARPALGLPALHPFVAGLAGDVEEGAQLREVEHARLERLDEADLLIHGRILSPGHRHPPDAHSGRECYPSTWTKLLPINPDCTMWPANMSLERTPTVRALECLVTPVGIWSIIESFWERSSPQRTRDFAAPSR